MGVRLDALRGAGGRLAGFQEGVTMDDIKAAGELDLADEMLAGNGGNGIIAANPTAAPSAGQPWSFQVDPGGVATSTTATAPDTSFRMNDGTTGEDIQALWDRGLDQAHKNVINRWSGGIWSFAKTSQNMGELVRNINFHFSNAGLAPVSPPAGGGVPPVTPPPGAMVSMDQQILTRVNNGEVIKTPELAQIGDVGVRAQAATQLAKNVVAQFGSTADALNVITEIYSQYIAGPGAPDFQTWTTTAGIQPVTTTGAGTTIPINVGREDVVDDTALRGDPQATEGNGGLTVELNANDEAIARFIGGFYKTGSEGLEPGTENVGEILQAAAESMVELGRPIGGQQFDNVDSARQFLTSWLNNPLKGGMINIMDYAAADVLEELPAGAGENAFFKFWGGPSEQRPFRQIYPGYTSLLPGYGASTAVQRAYAQAAAPLEMQYLARQATTPLAPPTEEGASSDIKRWLEGIRGGTEPMMMGQDYASFLRQLTGVLEAPEGARTAFMPITAADAAAQMPGVVQPRVPMNQDVFAKLAGTFTDPGAQLAAFQNPFYGATAGAPQMRQAIFDQIAQAHERYQYQHPSGAFLPWAIKENIAGIQNILPGLKPVELPESYPNMLR